MYIVPLYIMYILKYIFRSRLMDTEKIKSVTQAEKEGEQED